MGYFATIKTVASRFSASLSKLEQLCSSLSKLEQLYWFAAPTSSRVQETCSKNKDWSVVSLKHLGDLENHKGIELLRDKFAMEVSPPKLEQLHHPVFKATCSKNKDWSVVSLKHLGDSKIYKGQSVVSLKRLGDLENHKLIELLRDKFAMEVSPPKLEQLHCEAASTSSLVQETCSKNKDWSVASLRRLGDSEIHKGRSVVSLKHLGDLENHKGSELLRDKFAMEVSPPKLEQLRHPVFKATCSKNKESVELLSGSGSSTVLMLAFSALLLLQKLQHTPFRKVVKSCTRVGPVGIAASAVSLMMGASVVYGCAVNSGFIKHCRGPFELFFGSYGHAPARGCAGLPTEDQDAPAPAPVYVVNHYHGFSLVELALFLSSVSLLFFFFRRS